MRRTRRRFLSLLLSFISSIMLMLSFQNIAGFLSVFRNTDNSNILLVDTPGCKIPRTDPWDSSIYWYLKRSTELQCQVNKDVVYALGNTIYIDWKVVKREMPNLKYCKYSVIWRPADKHTHNNYYVLEDEREPFTNNVKIKDEFVRVQCYDKDNRAIYINAFSFVHLKPGVEKRCNDSFKPINDDLSHMSVLMVGVDSISRSNMIRYMPKTRKHLLKNMDALEFVGYNKVADNTFQNLVPMTTGKFVHELPWNSSMVHTTFDKFDFVWKEFSKKGYRTLYSEDSPYGQIFDYQKAGFSKPSADYFDRPFSLVMEELQYVWNTDHHCLHARPETQIALSYSEQFVTKFKTKPYFSFAFITRLTHDQVANAGKADKLYYEFLNKINKNNILNNTILIFYSDHGIRFGKLRQTFVGKIEERLPFLFFVFPKWFKYKYKETYRNLKINTKRLVTPFDIYETLVNILQFSNYERRREESYSLFDEIPNNRTCEDANIHPHWCTCSTQTVLSPKDDIVIKAANQLVNKLNEKIPTLNLCETLTLKNVLSATKIKPSDVLLKYVKTVYGKKTENVQFGNKVKALTDLQLMLETIPGGGIFEGTVRYDETTNDIEMLGDVSRINMYGTTSHCVKGIDLKKICYCKEQLSQT